MPIIYQDFDNEDQETAFGISDNAIADWAELDLAAINVDIGDIGPDFDLELLGMEFFTLDAPNFEPSSEDEQGKLDQRQLKFLTCPHCQKEFEIEQAKMRTQD
jgi:hypothetical protein